jgi:hypothetical protein
MFRKIICLLLAISLFGAAGCSLVSRAQETNTATPATVRTVREAKIGKTLIVKQLEIDLKAEVSIILELKDGDKVKGFFYLLKGDNVGFNISGLSPIYTFKTTDTESPRITSDEYAFTASQAQGIDYKLTLKANPNGKDSETTVFLEIIYPVTGSLFVPIGTK